MSRWNFWRDDRRDHERTPTVLTEATRARIQAERDLADARRELEQVRRDTPRHLALGNQIRKLHEENHLRAAFERSIQGGRS